jgi:hypothetical protein
MGANLQSIILAGTLFFLGLVSPGPNFLALIQSTLRGGQRSGIFAGLGAATGDGIYVLVGLLGFSTLSARGEWVFQVLKLVGEAYLTLLGIQMCLPHGTPTDQPNQCCVPGIWRSFLTRTRDRYVQSENDSVFWKYFRGNTSPGHTRLGQSDYLERDHADRSVSPLLRIGPARSLPKIRNCDRASFRGLANFAWPANGRQQSSPEPDKVVQ